MFYVGLDIGTTSISALMAESGTGRILRRETARNDAWLPSDLACGREQDPDRIVAIASGLIKALLQGKRAEAIGITGQMHGVVYTDENGKACSRLITWQDGRGDLPYRDGKTYAAYLSAYTREAISTGHGLVTLFYDAVNQRVPVHAHKICTIGDYAAMRLAGLKEPVVHASNAASLGFFDAQRRRFEQETLEGLGINTGLLPFVSNSEIVIGKTLDGTAVAVALGDNQAGFLGAVNSERQILVNIGTGSQVSALQSSDTGHPSIERRPYIDHGFLCVGASLCGGRAYQLLKDFYVQVLQMAGASCPDALMEMMDRSAMADVETSLTADTRFCGTREKPWQRGSIQNISASNLTPGALAAAVMRGICEELYEYYSRMEHRPDAPVLVGIGNGIRSSPVQRRILSGVFQMPVFIPEHVEEAAFGAALCAMHAHRKTPWQELRGMIRHCE